ncbi:MAG: T9SS type A sorting domain-containing protein [Bacteroidia bacterium]|nr:T9SS type A sorting domain-containing protein [Bacteroidia bacterium]
MKSNYLLPFFNLRFCSRLFPVMAFSMLISFSAHAQTIFSRFDFNHYPLTHASIGPNGTSVDADAVTNGIGAFISNHCENSKGLDLVVPNSFSIFDQPEFGMTFNFQRDESFARFFDRGNMSFYISGGILFIKYATTGPGGLPVVNGPFPTNFTLSNDNTFREYTFIYTQADGLARVLVGGNQIWSFDGPDGAALNWSGASTAAIGGIMDGNCNGRAVLDYAYFFLPSNNLPVEYGYLEANAARHQVDINWNITQQENNQYFEIQRSQDGIDFQGIGSIEGAGSSKEDQDYTFTDYSPGQGVNFYRIIQHDLDGKSSSSPVIRANFSGSLQAGDLVLYPNPAVESFRLKEEGAQDWDKVEVISLDGKVMRVWDYQTMQVQGGSYPVADLATGYYQVVLSNRTQLQTHGLVKAN